MNVDTALITGASKGIGFHLAREFAAHGHPLILVAPNSEELETAAAEIRAEHGVTVRTIAQDLTESHAADNIFEQLQAENVTIDVLVNNAGQGFRGQAWEIPLEHDIAMVRLNIEAVLRLTKLFLPPMVQRGRGRVLNVASVAGFEPGPLLAVYHASKAFVLSWSEALAIELEDTELTVTALCPGATDTDFFPKADMEGARIFQKGSVMAPQDVAKAGYEGLMKKELFVVPGGVNKALVAARRILSEGAQAKINQKFYEDVPVEERKRERGDFEGAAKG